LANGLISGGKAAFLAAGGGPPAEQGMICGRVGIGACDENAPASTLDDLLH
jgi:hypothetical protein